MKKFKLFLLSFLFISMTFADEGMLIPSVLDAFVNDMRAKGMKLTAKDIYDINHASLKDAIVQFGGGCTAEIVSPQGLIFTNHHCGFGSIQRASSLEHNYLRDGFWAKTMADEIPSAGMTATRIVRIENVTRELLNGITNEMSASERQRKIEENKAVILQQMTAGTNYEADIKAFDYGNSYYCLVKEVFKDIRLVGTPPNAIGKFGGDTDNWVWPRHTGDFSVFRIYANKNNQPAAYNKDNQPYQPLKYLPINIGNRTAREFTMVYGFPGSTEQHLTSAEIQFYQNTERPARIKMRDLSLEVIDAAMKSSEKIHLQYASKQAGIANGWKKWIGQVQGLKRLNAVQLKKDYEAKFNQIAASNTTWQKEYGTIVTDLNQLVNSNISTILNYSMYVEFAYVGPEFFKLIRDYEKFQMNYQSAISDSLKNAAKKSFIRTIAGFYKNYESTVDQQIFAKQYPYFLKKYSLAENNYLRTKTPEAWQKLIFEKSIFTNQKKLEAFINAYTPKSAKKIQKDPACIFVGELETDFFKNVLPDYKKYSQQHDNDLETYVRGAYELFPNEKHWPDANLTLRLSYGKLEGAPAADGVEYLTHTTVDGILAKHETGNDDYALSPVMVDFFQKHDYGKYAQNGEMWVCYLSSNHTTGGNSGSPSINGEGQLIGINFDRTWESTMSDFIFDPTHCRNICVDIRYVLYIIDKYAHAQRLIDELELVE